MPLDIKILIIDDSAFARTLLKLQLQLLDLNNVIEADSASEGWAILKSKNIDLVFLDHSMPGMTGLELLKKIRADEGLKTIKVIFLTGVEDHKVLINLKNPESFADMLYMKPVNYSNLKQNLKELLGINNS